jgi:hypothetical protein
MPSETNASQFSFDLKDIHGDELCIYVHWYRFTVDMAGKNRLCINYGDNPNRAVPADQYVTFMMLAGNKEQFIEMWE